MASALLTKAITLLWLLLDNTALSWVLGGVVSFVFFAAPMRHAYYTLGFLLPFETEMQLVPGVTIYTLLIPLHIVKCWIAAIRQPDELGRVSLTWLATGLGVLSTLLVGLLTTEFGIPSARVVLNHIAAILWVLLCYREVLRTRLNTGLLEGLVDGVLLSGGVGVIVHMHGVAALLVSRNPTVYRFEGLRGDPNYFAQLLLVTLGVLLFGGVNEQPAQRWRAWRLWLCIVFLVLTMSKMGLLGLMLLAVSYVFLGTRGFRARLGALFGGSLLLGLLWWGGLLNAFAQRFLDPRGVTTGRLELFWSAIEQMFESPRRLLFGVGIGNQNLIHLYTFVGAPEFLHNAYLEYFVAGGLLGGSAILAWYVSLLIKKCSTYADRHARVVFLITHCVFAFTNLALSGGFRKSFWLFMFL